MRFVAPFIALSSMVAFAACGGRVSLQDSERESRAPSSPPAPAPTSSGSASVPPANPVPAPTTTARPTPTPSSDPSCTRDDECNEVPGTNSGRCWRDPMTNASSCLCRQGAWKQPSGRCGATAPPVTCGAQGGTCGDWNACLNAGGTRALTDECGGGSDICCVGSCKKTAVDSCYVRGTDAAYVPVCTHGWQTCLPGDSPDLDI